MNKALKRVAVAVAAMLLALIGIVSCDAESACAAPTGVSAPRPAPAPRVPSFSKPSPPRPAPVWPSTPRGGSHSTTVVPVPLYVDNDGC